MSNLYNQTTSQCSKIVTRKYSTSFSIAISLVDAEMSKALYDIYGFVRLADEIVDSFHDYPKAQMLDRFREDTHWAVENGISTNPILNSFQSTVNKYRIPSELFDQFFKSMEMDLEQKEYDSAGIEEYILGSAEVVGLMCLKAFVKGDETRYNELKPYAMKLGSAFQKVNFLRDLKDDYVAKGRNYFPGVQMSNISREEYSNILDEIESEFKEAHHGIKRIPGRAKFGVYVAYKYYYKLFNKLKKESPKTILEKRVRIPNPLKFTILLKSFVRYSFNML